MKSAKSRAKLLRSLVRTDYATFVEKAFETACGEKLSNDAYIGVINKTALDIHHGRIRRAILSMPPRHGKTILLTVCLTAWELARRPNTKVLVICYGDELAKEIATKVRLVMGSRWYQDAFETRLRKGHDRANDFATTAGGRVFATHLGRGITGYGADLIILDDPNDIKDAEEPERLAYVRETFEGVIENRLNHPDSGRIVVVAHRINANDLAGHLLREGGWTQVKLPLVADCDQSHDVIGGVWNRRKGEVLRKGKFSAAKIERMRNRKTIPDFATLRQQSPPEATWRISPEHFRWFDALPSDAGGGVLSIDPAHVPGERNSHSVIQAWRSSGSNHFLIAQWRDKVTPAGLDDATRLFIRRYQPTIVLIESATSGISLLSSLEKRLGPVLLVPGTRFAGPPQSIPVSKAVSTALFVFVAAPRHCGRRGRRRRTGLQYTSGQIG